MEPRLHLVLLSVATFLLAYSPSASSQVMHFLQEPKGIYYLVKRKPATITCKARYASEIGFTCRGTKVPDTSVEIEDLSESDPDVMQASIEVTRSDVNNQVSEDDDSADYWCQCTAVDMDGQMVLKSRRAVIKEAYIRKRFKLGPIPTTTEVGDSIELLCEPPGGEPKPRIMWRKNLKRLHIKNNERYTLTERGSLVISDIQEEDTGEYQCVAKNEAGRRTSQQALVNVTALGEVAEAGEMSRDIRPREEKKASFIRVLNEEYSVEEDETFYLECQAKGSNMVTFRCDGVRIDTKSRLNHTETTGADDKIIRIAQLQLQYAFLRLIKKSRTDANKFQCQCIAWYHNYTTNRWDSIETNDTIGKIYLKFIDDKLKKEPKDLHVGIGAKVKMHCSPPDGNPKPWVTWYKGSSKIDPRSDSRYTIDRKGTLVIKFAELKDNGQYLCVATNGISQVQSRRAELKVTEETPPTTVATTEVQGPLVYVQDLELEYTLQNGVVSLTCTAESRTRLQITVNCGNRRLKLTNQKEIPMKNGYRVNTTVEVTSTMLAKNPDNYYCVCNSWLIVDGKWKGFESRRAFIRQESSEDSSEESSQEIYIEDNFIEPPRNIEVEYGFEAKFLCKPPKGNPEPQVYWLRNGDRLDVHNNQDYILSDDNTTLYIEYVEVKEHQAKFICVAENSAGTKYSEPATITVLRQPEPSSPAPEPTTTPDDDMGGSTTTYVDYLDPDRDPIIFKEPESENILMENEVVNLQCEATNSQNLTIICDDSTTNGKFFTSDYGGEKVAIYTLEMTGQELKLKINKEPYLCNCWALGKYEPAAGGVWVNGRNFTVGQLYMDEDFQKQPKSAFGRIGSRAELVCHPPKSTPVAKVQWIKEGILINSQEGKYIITPKGSLIILQLSEEDEGEYKCVASAKHLRKASDPAVLTVVGEDEVIPEPETTSAGAASPEPSSPEPLSPEPSSPEPDPTMTMPPKGMPFISKGLHTNYYVTKNKPVTIICEATSVSKIAFTCGMMEVPENRIKVKERSERLDEDDYDMITIMEASLTITKDDLTDYKEEQRRKQDKGDFYCQCRAYYPKVNDDDIGYLESKKGFVGVAYLRKMFQVDPVNTTVAETEWLQLVCQPPEGHPPPEVYWLKDNVKINSPVTTLGNLMISPLTKEDSGEYVCVAENEANIRKSRPAHVEVTEMTGTTDGVIERVTEGTGGTDSQTYTDDSIYDVETYEPTDVTDSSFPTEFTTYSDYDSSTTEYRENSESTSEENILSNSSNPTVEPQPQDKSTAKVNPDTNEPLTQTTDKHSNLQTSEEKDINMSNKTSSLEPEQSTTDSYIVSEKKTSEQEESSTASESVSTTGENTNPNPESTDVDHGIETDPTSNPHIEEDSTFVVRTSQPYSETDGSYEETTTPRPYDRFSTDSRTYYPLTNGPMDTDMPVHESSTEGEGEIGETTVEMSVSMCTDKMMKCNEYINDRSLQHKCRELTEYSSCMVNFNQDCSSVITDPDLMKIAMERKMNAEKECQRYNLCPNLAKCKKAFDPKLEMPSLDILNFCSHRRKLMKCANDKLSKCNSESMVSPMEGRQDSFDEMTNWFTQFCDEVMPKYDSEVHDCDCTLDFDLIENSNSSYWCGMVTSIKHCSMNMCVPEIGDTLAMQAEAMCPETDMEEPEGDSNEPQPSVDGDGGDDPDSALSVGASILLVTFTQVLVTAFFSHR